MKQYAHVSYHRMLDPEYRRWCDRFDGIYTMKEDGPCLSFWRNRSFWRDEVRRMSEIRPPKILLNECFGDSGLKRSIVNPSKNWLRDAILALYSECPGSEIWVTDCQPRRLNKWRMLREYVSGLPITGIGVQVHFDIGRGLVPPFLIAHAVFQCVRHQTIENQALGSVSFSEVSVLPGCRENIVHLGQIYSAIESMASRLSIDWLMWWSAEDSCSWHWDKSRIFNCGLYTYDLRRRENTTQN